VTSQLSRRDFTALAAAAVAAPFTVTSTSAATITAQDLVDRIKKQIGVEWKAESLDGIKAGDPATVIKGVATTSMATLDVLQQAVKAGANVVISAQPTFYSRSDARTPPAGRGAPPGPPPADPVFTAKNELIAKHNLVVIRLSEHWKLRQPDPLVEGIAAALGWTRYQSSGDPRQFDVPATTLDALAASVKKTLRSRGGMRIVGDPQTSVRRVGVLPGTTPIQASLKLLPLVDVIVAGEVREWESVEYARDVAFFGKPKRGLLLLGRVVSEEPGMSVCANWLKTVVAEVPVRHIAAGDPYWRPAQ
jgi:putative NIF3 family GTP cyclohydrolase 1 type 2